MTEERLDHQEPSFADVEFLEERLYEFNREATGIADGRGLGVFLRDPSGGIVAAVAGHTWGGTCELRQVWVAEASRRRGIGTRLIGEAEREARRRGCSQLLLTTHSFQAPRFYQSLGFVAVCEVADYPQGHSHLLFRKELARIGSPRDAGAPVEKES